MRNFKKNTEPKGLITSLPPSSHTKRDICMIIGAFLLLIVITFAIHIGKMANAGYEDQLKPKVTSLFHYQITGF